MNEEARAEWKRRVGRNAERIVRLIQLDAPDTILAADIVLLFWQAQAWLPHAVNKAMGETMTKAARRMRGACVRPDCDNEVAVAEDTCAACQEADDVYLEKYLGGLEVDD